MPAAVARREVPRRPAVARWWRVVDGTLRALAGGGPRRPARERYERAIRRSVGATDATTGAVAAYGPPIAGAIAIGWLSAVDPFILLPLAGLLGLVLRRILVARTRSGPVRGLDGLILEVAGAGSFVTALVGSVMLLGSFIGLEVVGLLAGGVAVAVGLLAAGERLVMRLGLRPPATAREQEVAHEAVGVARAVGVTSPAVMVIDDPAPNLLTFSDVAGSSILAVTTGFLDLGAPARSALLTRALVDVPSRRSLVAGLLGLLVSLPGDAIGRVAGSSAGPNLAAQAAAIVLGQERVLIGDAVAARHAGPERLGDALLEAAMSPGRDAPATATRLASAFGHLCVLDPRPHDDRSARHRAHPPIGRRVAALRRSAGSDPLSPGLAGALADER